MQKFSMKSFVDCQTMMVTIKTDEKLTATITCEKAKFTIPGKSGEDFAYLPLIEKRRKSYYLSIHIKRDD